MRIYPTNNSISYKILEKLNGYFFDAGVPKNVCGYFWLSVFYGVASVFVLYNVVVASSLLVTVILGLDGSYLNWIPTGLSLLGIILAAVIIVIVWALYFLSIWVVLPLAIILIVSYPFLKNKVEYIDPKQFITDLFVALLISVFSGLVKFLAKRKVPFNFKPAVSLIEGALKYLWNLKRFIKCKKLDFEEK